ncbi:MAG: hypothetical protein ACLRZ7_06150 [Lachnospiraceae bacterium]
MDGIPLDDGRQPGLHIRTPQGIRLNDEEMIQYYSKLVASLGGKVLSHYLDGVAVYDRGKISSFMENSEATKASTFYMVSDVHELRHPGWPLDSISIDKHTGKYFFDQVKREYEEKSLNKVLL